MVSFNNFTKHSLVKKIALGGLAPFVILIPTTALAWNTSQSARSICTPFETAAIELSFTNGESDRSMDVIAEDQQTGKTVNLGSVAAHQTKSGEIDSGKSSLNNGTILFSLMWTNDKNQKDQRSATYNAVTCQKPTPIPTPKPTATPTPQPTNTPIPTQTPIPPTPTSTSVPTQQPSPTNIPQPTSIPPVASGSNNNNANNNTNNNNNSQQQNVTQNANPVINVTNNNNPNLSNNNQITINNPVPTVTQEVLAATTEVTVAPSATTSQLPSTGAGTDVLVTLFSLFPAGFGLRKFSKLK